MDKKNINPIHAPLPYPIYPIGYEGSLTQTEAMGQFQAKLNELLDSYNALIGTFPNVVQTEGESTTDVMSQAATTKSLSKKLNRDDIVNELGSSLSHPTSQQLLTQEITKSNGLIYERIPKTDIVQVTGNSDAKVMSQAATTEAIKTAVEGINTYETVNFYQTSLDDPTYICDHTYADVYNGLSKDRRRYYFYDGIKGDGTQGDVKKCEVFPSRRSGGVLSALCFDGVLDAAPEAYRDSMTNAASFASITMISDNDITGTVSTMGVTNYIDSDEEVLSPSVKKAKETYVKYNDIETNNITPSSKKTISSAYASQNYSYGYRTGYFTPKYDNATQQIAFTGGRTGDANICTIEYTINCTIPEIVGTENTPFIKFVIGAVVTITTPIRIKQGINHIQIKRCTSNINMWTISNVSSAGSQEAVFSNTQLPTSMTYSNWIMGLSLNMPTGFNVAVIGGYSY
jgi:hypothetical protein